MSTHAHHDEDVHLIVPEEALHRFPPGFWWGTATAGHQIEGGNVASNWWAWEHEARLVEDGSVSGRACDYWHRYAEDHQRMVDYGLGAFRLGLEWSRLEPARDRFDDEALDHYVAILRDLRDRGLRVCLTLNHWVLPAWFADAGGWTAPDALTRWERFCHHVVPAVAPYVDLWVTLNEPMVPVLAGYLAGHHPPCHTDPREAALVFRRLLGAHAVAYRIVHDLVPTAPDGSPTQVGYAAAYQHIEPYHPSGPLHAPEALAARVVEHVSSGAWDRAVRTGRIPPPAGWGQRVPGLRGSTDFVGVNYYMRISVKLHPAALSNVKSGEYDRPPGTETTAMGWQIHPPGFRRVLVDVARRMRVPIYITENGCSDPTDDQRRRYLLTHLAAVAEAIEDGADVRGYFHWTFADNFEWREGFSQKFGLFAMDPDDPDLVRHPRPSAAMLRDIATENAVTPEIVRRYAPAGSVA